MANFKGQFPFTIILLVFLYLVLAGCINRKILVSDYLETQSERYYVKVRGFSSPFSMFKYRFDTYRLVSGKTGVTKTTYKSGLFSSLAEISSKSKASFVFTDQMQDTATVNLFFGISHREIDNRNALFPMISKEGFYIGTYTELLENTEINTALISTNTDTTVWTLTTITSFGREVKNEYEFKGWLTDGTRNIELHEIMHFSNGRPHLMGFVMGYELRENDLPVSAVQFGPNYNQNYVWLLREQDPKLKFILATAATALIAAEHINGGF